MPLVRGRFIAILALLGASLAPAIAANPTESAPAPATDLRWRGDITSARAFMNDIASQYEDAGLGHIDVEPFSTLSGLDAVADGSVDLAGIARPKHDRRRQEQTISFVPVALGAVVLIVHPRNPVDDLDLAEIRDIYLGRITNWKEVGGVDKAINLYSIAAPFDGVEYSLRALVFDNGRQPVAAPRLYLNTAQLEEAVAIDPSGFGVSTLSATRKNKGVKRLTVEGIGASSATIADASYPLSSALYLAFRDDSPKADAIHRLLAFLAEPAAMRTLRHHQLVPYGTVDNVIARHSAQRAFIDSRLGITPREPAAVAAAATPGTTENPNVASAEPTSIATQPESEKPEPVEVAKAKADVVKAEVVEADVVEQAATKPTVAEPDVETQVAATKPAAKPDFGNVEAAGKVRFDNVKAAVTTTSPTKTTFGNVVAGATTDANSDPEPER